MFLLRSILRVALLVALSLNGAAAWGSQREAAGAAAPPVAAPRVQGPIDDTVRVVLRGNVHPLIRTEAVRSRFVSRLVPFGQAQASSPVSADASVADQGAVEDSLPTGRTLLLLKRSPAQEAALGDFIQATHTPGNPSFHQWLTPEEFGWLYGPADSDVAAVTGWLESHGLTVNQVHAGRLAIEFSGTAGQMNAAFQTQIHRYLVNGETHLANATDPSVPAALAPVIAGLAPVSDFHPQPQLKVLGQAQFNAKTHQATPEWTYPLASGVDFVMAPGDFATQYDINSVYKSGITGTGQSIAIVSASNVDLSLVQAYQTLFGLSANLPQVVVDGEDPGENGAATEAYLDVEIAGSVAPGAKVMLYTSAGTALTDGLALAAYRAVEDDQAGVISVSYGECELELGQSGNAFWSALWQQAAAQGQTVFVSAGDGGSAGCDSFDTQQVAYSGLQVNGIASTPYDVAVGGTDFYYSQYAGTSSAISTQLGTYWSTTSTTAPAVSLKQYVPEQAWNDFFGFNLYDSGNPANQPSENILAGSGGASNDAVYSNGTGTGYPKPAWQSGTGVPSDKVRDLPDVSLFAANGYNYSFYPICASPGDCTNLNSNGTAVITGVGGTSCASPSMAAIQALIDQSTGSWQGQSDFIYYPLAAKQPSAFHDVTVGGNQVLCYPGTANCAAGSSATNSSGYSVEGGYPAGTGYNLATGLGSVDVANLIKYWSTVVFTPTTTTLSVSPVSLVHATTATVSGTVAHTTGSGTPSGMVSLTGNDGITHYAGIDGLSLAAGSFYAQVDNLPGGTYQLTAVYGGDGSFAASKSAPVMVTVTPENDTLTATGWAWNPYDLNLYPLSSGITIPYGAQIFLDAQPVSSNATIAGELTPATGTVTFTDTLSTAATVSTQPLNAAGVAEWSTGVFAPGSHTVGESYSGDASYNPSNAAGAASFTVIQGSTSLTVKPLVSSVAAGASVAVDVQLTTGYLSLYGALPTGNVTVTLGGRSVTAAWQAFGPIGDANLETVITFSNVPAGVLPLTASYAGDSNWMAAAANGGTVIALAGKLTPTVTLTTSVASPTPAQSFTLTATVAGPSGMPTPTGTIAFLADSQSFDTIATLSKGTASIAVPGYAVDNGTNIFTAVYQGDSNYDSAASNTVNVAVAQSNFSLTTLNAELPISPYGSGTGTLVLAPINGFSGTITLTASAVAGITVTPATATPTVSATVTDALTITVAASTTAGIYPLTITASGGGHIHTAQILVQVLAVAAPVISPAAGTYSSALSVTITDATSGAAIYYTTNGATPTASSTRYNGAIAIPATLPATVTVQAIAVTSGSPPSSVVSATYILAPPAATPTFSPAAGSYTAAQPVTIADATPGAAIYYTINGTVPTASSTKFSGALTVSAAETLSAIAVATGYQQSPVSSAVYIVNRATNGCPTGSGSCVDNFTGTSGTSLSTYNPKWVPVVSSSPIYTTGNSSAEIAAKGIAEYYYSASTSDTSQITILPSSTTIYYEKLACVRVSPGIPGYCVGFSSVSGGNYSGCYVMKDFGYMGTGNCATVSATASHTLRLVASGTSPVTLLIYVDGVAAGTVTDTSATPYTVAGPGFGLQGDGTPADSAVDEWQDYSAVPTVEGCPTGSGSCVDSFTGASGTSLSTYNSKWVPVVISSPIYTTGNNSAEIAAKGVAEYYYSASTSETSQITLGPSNTTIYYEKLACVRISPGKPGYCVGFSSVSNGNYSACYVMKDFGYMATGSCRTVSATASHTLRLVASGTSPVTLSIYVDGIAAGTVTDASATPYTVAGPGFGLQGDGTAADSDVTEWQDYGAMPFIEGCPTGSGSCVDTFTGASGTSLSTYNPQWVPVVISSPIYTTGNNSAQIAAKGVAEYYYLGSASETSQITLAPSSTTIYYEKLACVRVSAGNPGYCVGFSSVSGGNYSGCYVMKDFSYIGTGSCATVSATASHTLRLVASGTSPVTLSIYVDGVAAGTVTDTSATPYIVAGSGFGLQGDGTPADSTVTEWQDYATSPPVDKCPAGSGSCVDTFTGASGTSLSTYDPNWAPVVLSSPIYTTGNDSAEIAGTGIAEYYYSTSTADTSQITLAPSSTTIYYEKLACVRVSPGKPGYCVGFSSVSGGNYSGCYVMKDFGYMATGSCGTVSATASHTLRLVASGSSLVTLSIYVDGVAAGTVTDTSATPYIVAGSGFGLQGDGTPSDSAVTEWQD